MRRDFNPQRWPDAEQRNAPTPTFLEAEIQKPRMGHMVCFSQPYYPPPCERKGQRWVRCGGGEVWSGLICIEVSSRNTMQYMHSHNFLYNMVSRKCHEMQTLPCRNAVDPSHFQFPHSKGESWIFGWRMDIWLYLNRGSKFQAVPEVICI